MVSIHKVSAQVLETLRNPRLLGIAIDLLAAKDVEQLNELSVGRVMFEHMRKAQQTGATLLSGVDVMRKWLGTRDAPQVAVLAAEDYLQILPTARR